jgi:hypothetical protein
MFKHLFGRRARSLGPLTPSELADELLAVLASARPVPLTDQVRVNKRDAEDVIAAFEIAPDPALAAPVRAIGDALHHARYVPLTDEVRLPRAQLDELAQALRAAL